MRKRQNPLDLPEKTAIVFGDQEVTYQNLLEKVNRPSEGLALLGLQKGDHISSFMPNCPEVVYTFLAAMKLGLIYVGHNIMLKKDELDYIR